MKLISLVGTARSCFVEAVRIAKRGDIELAQVRIEEGNNAFLKGKETHLELMGEDTPADGHGHLETMLLLHAEDQLMSAETMKIVAVEFIDLYKVMKEKKVI